ncbi:MAG: VOC family protein [Caldilineaceae bacterium]
MFDPAAAVQLPFLKNGVWQIGVIVENLERSVEEYLQAYGVGPWNFYTYQKPFVRWMTYYGEPVDAAFRIALARMGPQQIELIEPISGPTIYHDFIAQHGYGFHHIGLLVDDWDAAMKQAAAAGLAVIQAGGGHGLDGDGGFAYLDTTARFNCLMELMIPPQRRQPPEKIYPSAA